MKPIIFPFEEYGQRVILTRTYLSECDGNALALLCQVMNDFVPSSFDVTFLADGNMSFSFYSYLNGYVFVSSLSQAQAKTLHYLFKNPYKKAEKLFVSYLHNEVSITAEELSLAKERLISKMESVKLSSYFTESSAFPYHEPYAFLKKEKIESLTKQELSLLLKKIGASHSGEVYVLGKEKMDELEGFSFENSLPLLSGSSSVKGKSQNSDDETIFLHFKHDDILSLGDLYALKAALNCHYDRLKELLEKKISVILSSHLDIVSPTDSYLSISFKKGLKEQLLSLFDAEKKYDISSYIHRELLKFNVLSIKGKMDSNLFFFDEIQKKDLGLNDSVSVDEEKVKRFYDSLSFVREENNND